MGWIQALLEIINKVLSILVPSILKSGQLKDAKSKSYQEFLTGVKQNTLPGEVASSLDAQLEELKNPNIESPTLRSEDPKKTEIL
jgi:hypothetical protein